MFDPKSMAILMNGQPFSYEQLETKLSKLIDQLACYQDHTVLGLASDKAWLSYLFVLACSQLDQTLFLLNPKLPAWRLQQLVDQSGCKFVINDSQLVLSTETTIVDVKHFFSIQ